MKSVLYSKEKRQDSIDQFWTKKRLDSSSFQSVFWASSLSMKILSRGSKLRPTLWTFCVYFFWQRMTPSRLDPWAKLGRIGMLAVLCFWRPWKYKYSDFRVAYHVRTTIFLTFSRSKYATGMSPAKKHSLLLFWRLGKFNWKKLFSLFPN